MSNSSEPVQAGSGLTFYRRQTLRRRTWVPASIRLVGRAGEVFARGRAVITDLSPEGVGLSRVRFHEGHLPLAPHQVVIEPSAVDLREHVFHARPVNVRFYEEGVAMGAAITRPPKNLLRLLNEPIPGEEQLRELG